LLGEVLLHHLSKQEIFVSTGSACNASSKKLSPVLQALGFSMERIRETIRISLAANEIPDDHDIFLERFNRVVSDLQKMLT
jgi:cysteine desulfurase